MRENVYEIVDYNTGHEVVATFWWDGRHVQSDNKRLLANLKAEDVYGHSFEDTKEWLNELPKIFRSGYRMARRAKHK